MFVTTFQKINVITGIVRKKRQIDADMHAVKNKNQAHEKHFLTLYIKEPLR